MNFTKNISLKFSNKNCSQIFLKYLTLKAPLFTTKNCKSRKHNFWLPRDKFQTGNVLLIFSFYWKWSQTSFNKPSIHFNIKQLLIKNRLPIFDKKKIIYTTKRGKECNWWMKCFHENFTTHKSQLKAQSYI